MSTDILQEKTSMELMKDKNYSHTLKRGLKEFKYVRYSMHRDYGWEETIYCTTETVFMLWLDKMNREHYLSKFFSMKETEIIYPDVRKPSKEEENIDES
jgi:hypothetical protein